MEPFAALERAPVVGLLRTSFYVYPVLSALHVAAVGALLACVMFLDVRLLGGFRSMPEAAFVALMRRTAVAAFAVAAVSGALLFSVRATDYAASTLFRAKLILILLAGVNLAVFIGLARHRPVSARPRPAERTLASVSLGLWISVLLCGRFLGFV